MPGDCHYLDGNANAKRRVAHVADLLDQIGLEGDRIHMFNISSAMAGAFVEATEMMTETIKGIGPNPLKVIE